MLSLDFLQNLSMQLSRDKNIQRRVTTTFLEMYFTLRMALCVVMLCMYFGIFF